MPASAGRREVGTVDDDAERRIVETLSRVGHVAASGEFQVLRSDAAHRRDGARLEAERAAAAAGRSRLVADARDAVRRILEQRFTQFHPRVVYGWAADVTTAADRVEIMLALEDLLLARTVEDLVPAPTYVALAGDGEMLVAEPDGAFDFEAAGLEVGGPVASGGTYRPPTVAIGLIVAVLVGIPAVVVTWVQVGPWAAVLAAILAATILFTIAKPPPHWR